MKKFKSEIISIFLICLTQTIYFNMIRQEPLLFAYAIKLHGNTISHLDICAKWLIYLIVIIFVSNIYSFYVQKNGFFIIPRFKKRKNFLNKMLMESLFFVCLLLAALFLINYVFALGKSLDVERSILNTAYTFIGYFLLAEIVILVRCICAETITIVAVAIGTLVIMVISYVNKITWWDYKVSILSIVFIYVLLRIRIEKKDL